MKMTKIDHRPLGRTGIDVSVIGFGAAPLANLFWEVPESTAIETIHAALDRGITCFDTAPVYGNGLSEERLAIGLGHVPRASYTLSTKVGQAFKGKSSARISDYSRDGVYRSLEGSLSRLQVEYVDIVHIHDPDHHYAEAIGEAYPALDDLRRQGVIKAVSVGINQWQMLVDFMRDGDFDCFMLAGRYTLLEQGALSLLDACAERGIGILLAGVYNTGILATGAKPGAKYQYLDATPQVLEKTAHIEAVCARYDVPLKAAALQFGLAHPAISSLVLGCSRPQRIDDNLDALNTSIPDDLWIALRNENLLTEDSPLPSNSS